MRSIREQGVNALCLALALVIFTGCTSNTQTELPPQMTQSLAELRDQLVQGKAQLQTTCNAARDLTQRPQADMQAQVSRLTQAITSMENLATNNRQEFASADERAQAYFEHWNKELQSMSTSMAEAGQERREKSMRAFTELKTRTETLRSEFRPFMTSLNEISRYLKTDTTSEGVKTVTPQIKSTLARENAIMTKADAVIEQIDAMRGGK